MATNLNGIATYNDLHGLNPNIEASDKCPMYLELINNTFITTDKTPATFKPIIEYPIGLPGIKITPRSLWVSNDISAFVFYMGKIDGYTNLPLNSGKSFLHCYIGSFQTLKLSFDLNNESFDIMQTISYQVLDNGFSSKKTLSVIIGKDENASLDDENSYYAKYDIEWKMRESVPVTIYFHNHENTHKDVYIKVVFNNSECVVSNPQYKPAFVQSIPQGSEIYSTWSTSNTIMEVGDYGDANNSLILYDKCYSRVISPKLRIIADFNQAYKSHYLLLGEGASKTFTIDAKFQTEVSGGDVLVSNSLDCTGGNKIQDSVISLSSMDFDRGEKGDNTLYCSVDLHFPQITFVASYGSSDTQDIPVYDKIICYLYRGNKKVENVKHEITLQQRTAKRSYLIGGNYSYVIDKLDYNIYFKVDNFTELSPKYDEEYALYFDFYSYTESVHPCWTAEVGEWE